MLHQHLCATLSGYTPWLLEKRSVAFLTAAYLLTLIFLVRVAWQRRAVKWTREPPSAPAKVPIPYLGHMFGLMEHRVSYFAHVGKRLRQPISTIGCFGSDMHVIASPKFLPSIQRQPRVISSRYFISTFVTRMSGASRNSVAAFSANLDQAEGDNMLLEGVRITKRILNSQTGTEMTNDLVTVINKHFEKTRGSDHGIIDLWKWISDLTIVSLSEVTHGPENPFWRQDIIKAFWSFVNDGAKICFLSLLRFPDWLVSRLVPGFNAREELVQAIKKYLDAGDYKQGSPIINAHFPLFSAHLDSADVPRFESLISFATFANTAPTAFWVTYHVFSDPVLLDRVRKEVAAITSTTISKNGQTRSEINIKKLKKNTVLFSVIKETARYRVTGNGFRTVIEDTTIGEGDDVYHLRAGSLVVIPFELLHFDKDYWGPDADMFVADRFKRDIPSGAYFAFGKGTGECCGKNFALYHVASFIALLAMQYDIVPVNGVWEEPKQDARNHIGTMPPPIEDLQMRLLPRPGSDKVLWQLGKL